MPKHKRATSSPSPPSPQSPAVPANLPPPLPVEEKLEDEEEYESAADEKQEAASLPLNLSGDDSRAILGTLHQVSDWHDLFFASLLLRGSHLAHPHRRTFSKIVARDGTEAADASHEDTPEKCVDNTYHHQ